MPPKFMKEGFLFTEDEQVPDHEEAQPSLRDKDPSKWHILGFTTFTQEGYPLAIDVESENEAKLLATARLRHLEVTQPTITSGGQEGDVFSGGIQDRVYIYSPGSSSLVRFNPLQSELFGNSPEKP
jgi:hypothetical protein